VARYTCLPACVQTVGAAVVVMRDALCFEDRDDLVRVRRQRIEGQALRHPASSAHRSAEMRRRDLVAPDNGGDFCALFRTQLGRAGRRALAGCGAALAGLFVRFLFGWDSSGRPY
jgi:hypothetical protein